MRNLHTNEVIDYLAEKINLNSNKDSDIGSNFIQSQEFLIKRIRLSLLISFA